jgi:predicted deacylase
MERQGLVVRARSSRPPFTVGGVEIAAGGRADVELPITRLSTHTPITLPLHVVHGRREGPTLFVCAAVHGDELNGVEIVRRLVARPLVARLRGTLLAIPIVNVLGFVSGTRYLPDRRDLNRSFPGSEGGSMAGQLAHMFTAEILDRATHGIDLHTAALHRSNLPQIRAELSDPTTASLARAFGAPVMLASKTRPGSLREAAKERGVPLLVYEAGTALRFDETAIRAGVDGVLRVMSAIGMLAPRRTKRVRGNSVEAYASSWVRAPESGILRNLAALGAWVEKDASLGLVADPLARRETAITAARGGVVIGKTDIPTVHRGDAVLHIAHFRDADAATEAVGHFADDYDDDTGGPI